MLLNDLKRRICNAYGHDLTMSYINNDITIPIKKQMDLDNAVALLDFSPQLTSLRIYLSNEAGGSLILVNSSKSFRKNLLNNNGFWGERISWVGCDFEIINFVAFFLSKSICACKVQVVRFFKASFD